MEREKRKALEAAGFQVGDVEDFLGLTEEELRLVELRVAVSRTVRRLRERQHLTQQQLAVKLKSSQSRIAKLEAGAPDVSLDLLFRGLFAVGGKLADLTGPVKGEPAADKVQTSRRWKPAPRPAGT
jgi:DNA-binding XRE family transcriptional regulator